MNAVFDLVMDANIAKDYVATGLLGSTQVHLERRPSARHPPPHTGSASFMLKKMKMKFPGRRVVLAMPNQSLRLRSGYYSFSFLLLLRW